MSDLVEYLKRIEAALEELTSRIDALSNEIKEIAINAQRNRVVAEKYGDRADSLFSVVDSVGTAMNRLNPLTYMPRMALGDKEEEDDDFQ